MRSTYATTLMALLITLAATQAAAQEITGRVVEESTGNPVSLSGVFLLDAGRVPIVSILADSAGRFRLKIPAAGSYYISAERLGYVTTESPLLAVSDSGRYEMDIELRPDPFQLDPLSVVVRNERLERWTLLRGQIGDPRALFGYRAIQGATLNEARARARDNTDFFRWLYMPVSHGMAVCIRVKGGCAKVFVDDRWLPAELLESIDLAAVIAVVVLPLDTGPELHIFTVDFDWYGVPRLR